MLIRELAGARRSTAARLALVLLSVPLAAACMRPPPDLAQRPASSRLVDLFYPSASLCAGNSFTCALHRDGFGSMRCWGSNALGQWGNGSTVAPLAGGPSLATDTGQLACNAQTTCAADFGGALRCFGSNAAGQIGTGSKGGHVATPFHVMDAVAAVAVGAAHVCGVKETGDVWCWGSNSHGQLGIGAPGDRATPARVASIDDAYHIAAGYVHTCILHADDTIQCWGFNRQGQLGPGNREIELKPVDGPALQATQLAAGAFHTCALSVDRTVWCWGSNDHQQLGRATTGSYDANAAQVPGISRASRIAAGAYHTCAVHSGGRVSCWGANDEGQAGAIPSTTPVGVTAVSLPVAYDVAAGSAHSCARVSRDRVECWGQNDLGQLTDGTQNDSWIPVP